MSEDNLKEWVELGRHLREMREYLGYSQDQVANFLNLHRPSVTMMESGGRRVDALELTRLAKLYGVPVDYFLGTPAPDGIGLDAKLLVGLDPEDVGELNRFADYLKWRKLIRSKHGIAGTHSSHEAGNEGAQPGPELDGAGGESL